MGLVGLVGPARLAIHSRECLRILQSARADALPAIALRPDRLQPHHPLTFRRGSLEPGLAQLKHSDHLDGGWGHYKRCREMPRGRCLPLN